MPVLDIRSAVPADATAITDVQLAAWTCTYDAWIPAVVAGFDHARTAANWARAAADPGQHVAVATLDGTIAGYALTGGPEPDSLADGEDPASTGELHALYVHPDAQGRSLGRLLVTDALRTLAGLGRRSCVLWTIERNPRARGFYERLGFTVDAGASRLWHGLDEVRYRIPTHAHLGM